VKDWRTPSSGWSLSRPRSAARAGASMLEDVLERLVSAWPQARCTSSPPTRSHALARRHGAACLVESADRGQTEAVPSPSSARPHRSRAIPHRTRRCPCVTAEEVTAALGALGGERGVLFVPLALGLGTNAAALAPPDVMPLQVRGAVVRQSPGGGAQRGWLRSPWTFRASGLDIDAPEDLPLLVQRGPETRSGALCRGWGLTGVGRDPLVTSSRPVPPRYESSASTAAGRSSGRRPGGHESGGRRPARTPLASRDLLVVSQEVRLECEGPRGAALRSRLRPARGRWRGARAGSAAHRGDPGREPARGSQRSSACSSSRPHHGWCARTPAWTSPTWIPYRCLLPEDFRPVRARAS